MKYGTRHKLRAMRTTDEIKIGNARVFLNRSKTYGYYRVVIGMTETNFYYYLYTPPQEDSAAADKFQSYLDALEDAVEFVDSHAFQEAALPVCPNCQRPFAPAYKWQIFCGAGCRQSYHMRMYNRRKRASA